MNTTADAVLFAVIDRITATELGTDQVNACDKFTALPSLDALIADERDRIFYPALTSGPMPVDRSRCKDTLSVTFCFRYFGEFESMRRMLRDMPIVRERIRTAVAGNVSGLDSAKVGAPTYDTTSLAKHTIAQLPVTLEYHVEVG